MFVLLYKINFNDKSDKIKIWWCKINTIQLYMKKDDDVFKSAAMIKSRSIFNDK